MTSCAGHVDGMKKWIDNNSTITHQNQSKLFRQNVHGLAHFLMQNILLSRLHTRSQALFNEIIICAIFISENAIQKLLLHELIVIIHGYDQRVSKVDLRVPGHKGFMFTIKEVWTEYAAQKINFLTSTIANGCPLPL